jgi:hypothetical protein
MDPTDEQMALPEKRKKKNKTGRAGRRRRAKLRDIQASEEFLFAGESIEAIETKSCIPTDRSKVWPGVFERRESCLALDEAALVAQLGYFPGNAVSVAARAKAIPSLPVDEHVPIVLRLYPLAIRDEYAGGKSDGRKFKGRKRRNPTSSGQGDNIDNASNDPADSIDQNPSLKNKEPLLEPFPTQYWLTHPILRTLTSKLELTDHVRTMQERLQSESNALESMIRAHQAYGQERWESLTKRDLILVQERKWEPALDSRRGVAGISRHKTVKCLHTHLAHHLSGGKGSEDNIVGKWVLELIVEMLKEKGGATSS